MDPKPRSIPATAALVASLCLVAAPALAAKPEWAGEGKGYGKGKPKHFDDDKRSYVRSYYEEEFRGGN